MGKIKITTDSTSSLPKNLLSEQNISLIYLEIKAGNHYYLDCEEITGDNLFEFQNRTGIFPKAIPISKERFSEFFSGFSSDYDSVIHLSSSLESRKSYENALEAAKDYPAVQVVDTRQFSFGIGLLALYAASLSKKGAPLQEIIDGLEQYRLRTHTSILIGTMEYFYHSDRCTNLTRRLTSFFHVLPGITVVNGHMAADRMYQGDSDATKKAFISDFFKQLPLMKKEILILASSGCTTQFIQQLYEEIISRSYFEHIILAKDSAVIASYCGPNTFGMYCFYQKEPKGRLKHEIFNIGG